MSKIKDMCKLCVSIMKKEDWWNYVGHLKAQDDGEFLRDVCNDCGSIWVVRKEN